MDIAVVEVKWRRGERGNRGTREAEGGVKGRMEWLRPMTVQTFDAKDFQRQAQSHSRDTHSIHATAFARIPTKRTLLEEPCTSNTVSCRHHEAHSRADHQLALLPEPTQRARARPPRYALHPDDFLKGTDRYTCIVKKSQLIHYLPLHHRP